MSETAPEDLTEGNAVPATDPAGRAGRWSVTAISLVTIAAFFVALFGLKETASILMPTFLAINLVIAAHPLQQRLEKKGLPKWAASLAVLFVLYLVLVALVGMLVWSVWIAAEEIPNYLDKFTALYNSSLERLSGFGVSEEQIQKSLQGIDPKTVMSTLTSVTNSLSAAGSQLLVLVLAITFLSFDIPGIARRSHEIRAHRPHLSDALDDFNQAIRSYWLVSTIFGLIVATIDIIALWALNIPLVLVWGVLAFVTNYIPNIGFVIGLVPPALFALLTGGPMSMLWVVVAYCLINFVIQSLIQPKFTGDAVGLSASVTFLSLVFWSAIAGPLGAILAVPLTLAAKALFIDPDPSMRWLSTFVTTADAQRKKATRNAGRGSSRASAGPNPR